MAIFFISLAILAGAFLIFEKQYEGRIYPGIRMGNIDLSGLTKAGAEKLLGEKIDDLNRTGLRFKYADSQTTLTPTISSLEADLAYRIVSFEPEKTSEEIFSFGRDRNFFLNLQDKATALIFGKQAGIIYSLNEGEIEKILKTNYEKFANPGRSAALTATTTPENPEKIIFSLDEEKLGKVIDYARAIEELKIKLNKLDFSAIELTSKTDYPSIYKNECLNVEAEAEKILETSPLTLVYQKKKWIIEKKQLADMLALERRENSQDSGRNKEGEIIVSLSPEKLTEFLEKTVAPEIEREPIDARFKMSNGRVAEFQGSQDGLKLKIEDDINKIRDEFINNKNNTVELTTEEMKSTVDTGTINDLGIREIIGTGESNFAGSPVNRRHNIKVGSDSLNGILIKPDEEFSLNKALGEIEAETGYLPELVIKGNETIPEYGGGLCQIGTTMFRGAVATGLPITMRQNHSYRVSYYEPAGTDATIYSPWPDVRFINDTGHYILIQTRIAGDNLYFDFWGTNDGRIVEKTDPTIYNIVKPGPTKIVETLDLPVGEKKCTEKAHNGADAYFDYKVTYPASTATSTPEVKSKRFSSHYVPWQEVCLIGVEELTTASSTPENADIKQ
ncbi:MAG: VanW family protein [Patescibacteria group bacterium]|nr:VanW family protein [Patescibacteria group bacterium]MDD5294697.1 VanW family protein [Patescibacteria group bacterium]MDD5554682.1 VanW family protein [Patescibacteria group bacterium]